MKKFIIVIMLILDVLSLAAQNKIIDSLTLLLKKNPRDTSYVKMLNTLAGEYQYYNMATLYEHAQNAAALASELGYKKGLATAQVYIGVYHSFMNKHNEATKFYTTALSILPASEVVTRIKLLNTIASNQSTPLRKIQYLNQSIALAEKIRHRKVGNLYHNLANAYYDQSRYKDAFQYYSKGYQAAEKAKDSISMIVNLDGIGSVLDAQGDEKNFFYKQKALMIAERLKNDLYIAWIKCHFIRYYQKKHQYDTSIAVGYQTIASAKKVQDHHLVGNAFSEMGYTFQLKGNIKKAIACYKEGLLFTKNAGGASKLNVTLLTKLGEAYNADKQYTAAIRWLNKAVILGRQVNAKSDLTQAYQNLSEAYSHTSNFKEAYHYQNLYMELKDSLYGLETKKQIATISTKYEVARKDQDIKILRQKNKIKDLQLSRSKFQLTLLIAFCLLIVISISLLYKQYRIKTKANIEIEAANRAIQMAHRKTLENVEEKEVLLQEIHHRVKNNLQLISSLLKWQTESIHDDRIISVISEGRSRIKSMALIHEALYQSNNLAYIKLDTYIGNLLEYLKCIHDGSCQVAIHKQIDDGTVDVDMAVPIGLIVTELVSNAFKHAFHFATAGKIEVLFYHEAPYTYILKVSDNGIGIQEELMNSTTTMGMELVKILVKQIKGQLEVYNDDGTNIKISFSNIHYHRKNLSHQPHEAYQDISC